MAHAFVEDAQHHKHKEGEKEPDEERVTLVDNGLPFALLFLVNGVLLGCRQVGVHHIVELEDEGKAERNDLRLVFPALHGRSHPHPYYYEECEEAYHGSISYLLVVACHHSHTKEELEGKLHRFEVIVLRPE